MKLPQIMMLLFFVAFSNQVMAYGSSSSKKACRKPTFSKFTPAKLSEVQAEAEFSFVASAITNPKTIKVTVKKQEVTVTIEEKNNQYLVTGNLPADLTGTHARVNINATGTNNCKGSDGWLLKLAKTEE